MPFSRATASHFIRHRRKVVLPGSPGTCQVRAEPQQVRGCAGHCLPRGAPRHPQMVPRGHCRDLASTPRSHLVATATALPATWERRGAHLHRDGARVLGAVSRSPGRRAESSHAQREEVRGFQAEDKGQRGRGAKVKVGEMDRARVGAGGRWDSRTPGHASM